MANEKITEIKRTDGLTEYRDGSGQTVGYSSTDSSGITQYYDTHLNKTGRLSYDDGSSVTKHTDSKGNFAGMSYKDADGMTQYRDEHMNKVGTGYTNSDGLFTSSFFGSSSNKTEQKQQNNRENRQNSSSGSLFSGLFSSGSSDNSGSSQTGYGSSYESSSHEDPYSSYQAPVENKPQPARTRGSSETIPSARSYQQFMPSQFNEEDGRAYARYAAYLLVSSNKQPQQVTEKAEKETVTRFGPFDFLRKTTKKTVRIPREYYFELQNSFEEYKNLNEYVSSEEYHTHKCLTVDGRIKERSFTEQYYTTLGAVSYNETYNLMENGYNEIPLKPEHIALIDYRLHNYGIDMTYDKFLSTRSSCIIREGYLNGFNERLEKERKTAVETVNNSSGRYSMWQWAALIAFVLALVYAGSGIGRIFMLLAAGGWGYLYLGTLIDEDFFCPQNPNSISFEVITMILTAAVIVIRYVANKTMSGSNYKNGTSLLFLGAVVACMAMSLLEKLAYQNKGSNNSGSSKKIISGFSTILSDKKKLRTICAVITFLAGAFRLVLTLFWSRDPAKFTSLILFASAAAMLFEVDYRVPAALSGLFLLLNLKDIITLTEWSLRPAIMFAMGMKIAYSVIASAAAAFLYYMGNKEQ